jgi:hypothetical protein
VGPDQCCVLMTGDDFICPLELHPPGREVVRLQANDSQGQLAYAASYSLLSVLEGTGHLMGLRFKK